jgi:multiple sugar transport system substrate-binding protein
MIPSAVFYFALVHNRTWLQKAGLKPPADDWKWSEVPDLLRAIKKSGVLPAGAYASHNLGQEADSFVNWIGGQGYPVWKGRELGFPKQVVTDWFTFWEGLRKEGLTETPDVMVQETGSLIEQSNIANGRTFLTARPPNRLDAHQKTLDAVRPGEQLGIVPYPRGPKGISGMDLGTNGIAIGANCKDAAQLDASVKWINFFTQDDRAAAIYESDNGVVAIDRQQTAQANGPKTTRGQREQILTFQRVVGTANPVAWPANGYANIVAALTRAYQAVAFETMKPDAGADQFMAEIKDLMAK